LPIFVSHFPPDNCSRVLGKVCPENQVLAGKLVSSAAWPYHQT